MTTRKTEPARAQRTRRATAQARGYPSNLTDAQWQVIVPHLPAEPAGHRGRPRVWPLRRIVEAILYLDRTGCAWRYLPHRGRALVADAGVAAPFDLVAAPRDVTNGSLLALKEFAVLIHPWLVGHVPMLVRRGCPPP